MSKNNDFFLKILKNTRTAEIDYFLVSNIDAIKKALDLDVSVKVIYDTVIKESSLSISYGAFLKKIKKIEKIKTPSLLIENRDNKEPSSNPERKEPLIIKTQQKKFEFNNDKN